MKVTFPEREFQLWKYDVSHGQLLVRSPKSSHSKKNIDVIFAGVEYIELPRHLPELEIEETLEEDVAYARGRLGRNVLAERVTVLRCKNIRYIVVAAGCDVAASDMDIFDSPF